MYMKSALFLLIITIILYGCAAKISPVAIEAELINAQSAITAARNSRSEDFAKRQLMKAEQLFSDAQKARDAGKGNLCLDLAFQANMEANIAAAQARRVIAENRLKLADAERVKAELSAMAYKVTTAQARRAIAERKAQMAIKEAHAAKAEAKRAREEADRQIKISKVQAEIEKANLMLKAAVDAEAEKYAKSMFVSAQRFLAEAKSRLEADSWKEATDAARRAYAQASDARVAAIAAATAIKTEIEATKRKAYIDAKVAISNAQRAFNLAEEANASVYALKIYPKAQRALNDAKAALKSEKFDQAISFATQAESHAANAQRLSEAKEREIRAQEERDELIAQAKDAIFKAKESLNQVESANALPFASQSYAQAKIDLAEAEKALTSEDFKLATTLAKKCASSLEGLHSLVEKIQKAETDIQNSARAIANAVILQTDEGIMIRLGGELFAKGNSNLNTSLLPELKKLVDILKKHPEYKVSIEGYTDSIGDANANLQLSKKRASNFLKYLVQQGISEDRPTSVGYGEEQPIATNINEAGRRQNRRIEVVILTRQK